MDQIGILISRSLLEISMTVDDSTIRMYAICMEINTKEYKI